MFIHLWAHGQATVPSCKHKNLLLYISTPECWTRQNMCLESWPHFWVLGVWWVLFWFVVFCLRIKFWYYVSLKYSSSTKVHYAWSFFLNSLHYFLYPMTNACRKSLLNPAFLSICREDNSVLNTWCWVGKLTSSLKQRQQTVVYQGTCIYIVWEPSLYQRTSKL